MRRLAGAVGAALVVLGCQNAETRRCQEVVKSGDNELAAQVCEAAYRRDRNPKSGLAAARSHFALGHEAAVLAWRKRLTGTTAEADAVYFVGRVHAQADRDGLARQALHQARLLYRRRGNPAGEAKAAYYLFRIAWVRSQYREALEAVAQGLEAAIESRDPELERIATENLFVVLFTIGDIRGAKEALDLAKRKLPKDDKAGLARYFQNRGIVRSAEHRPHLARRDLEESLRLSGGEAGPEVLRTIYLNLTQIWLDLGRWREAKGLLAKARGYQTPEPLTPSIDFYEAKIAFAEHDLATAERVLEAALRREPPADWAWDIEYLLGQVSEAGEEPAKAEAAYARAAAIVEELRSSLPTGELRTDLLERKRQPLESLFALRARSGRTLLALETAEQIKARALLDAFLKSASWPRADPARPGSLGATVRHLESLEPLVPALTSNPAAPLRPAAEVVSRFGNRHALFFVEVEEALWVFVIDGGTVVLHRLPQIAREVEQLAKRFREHASDPEASRLAQALFPPGSLPDDGETLYVIAEGTLSQIPFAALRVEGRFLVERWPVVLAPSLNTLLAAEERKRRAPNVAVVIADARGDLPGSAVEAREVGQLLGVTPRVGGQATADALFAATGARVLHLATHSGHDARGGWLQLSDREVTSTEVVRSRLSPSLVVLATCAASARAQREIWGSLDAAFLAAGSRSVLSSLWSLDDASARGFVLSFYREGGATDPAGALARAQRVAIREGASPTVWAPFVLMGSGKPLDNPEERNNHALRTTSRGFDVELRAQRIASQ